MQNLWEIIKDISVQWQIKDCCNVYKEACGNSYSWLTSKSYCHKELHKEIIDVAAVLVPPAHLQTFRKEFSKHMESNFSRVICGWMFSGNFHRIWERSFWRNCQWKSITWIKFWSYRCLRVLQESCRTLIGNCNLILYALASKF